MNLNPYESPEPAPAPERRISIAEARLLAKRVVLVKSFCIGMVVGAAGVAAANLLGSILRCTFPFFSW